jgi:hypothetical protein
MGIDGTQRIRPHDHDPHNYKDRDENVFDHGLAAFVHTFYLKYTRERLSAQQLIKNKSLPSLYYCIFDACLPQRAADEQKVTIKLTLLL